MLNEEETLYRENMYLLLENRRLSEKLELADGVIDILCEDLEAYERIVDRLTNKYERLSKPSVN